MTANTSKTKAILSGAALLVAAAAMLSLPGAFTAEAKKPPGNNNGNNGNNQPNNNNLQIPQGKSPKVEVVFVLDTTGSMSGLLEGAKAKIWGIANHIASGNPRPQLKVGLIGFRDVGDEYVTKAYELTGDLDQVYANLKKFQAGGGGDTPEHVNQALDEAVNKMQWSDGAMKMVFLVGDAPPHTDYKDGFDYKTTVKAANKKEISIYAIRCGNDPSTERVWREIAVAGRGVYASIAQDGAVAVVATPHDGRLAELSRKLDETNIVYGGDDDRRRVAAKLEVNAAAPPPAAADRGGYYAKSGARLDDTDLVAASAAGEVSLDKLEAEKLPEPMKKMSKEEQKKFVEGKSAERAQIVKEMGEVSAQRDAYLREESKKNKRADGFDSVVNGAIVEQGKAHGIAF